ncbi:Hemolysin, contains CBS domains [Humidesulfovibrio mexicanus]|uniref:Hemolysin, contains CBS domains n=1 Tax=Humidesulfovibrio mexicanus TaxID=147047 RepID=A0A239B0C4_9BACT|nr:hemolysin family protein [Humidesulfovibrio mexicanus]SNS01250.1 Hemolysin, contains CBS domains [Humidesulfovibrio mexicanus]
MLELILAVALATGVSFLCSLTEAAFYSFPMSRIEQLRREGRKAGDILAELRRDMERPITAVLTFNTAANTAGAAVAGAAAVKVFGDESLALFTAAFTLLLLVLGEIVPKTTGVAYARQLAPFLATPLKWLIFVCLPVVWLLGSLTRYIRKRQKAPQADEDDIRALVSLTRQQGILKPYEESAIRSILALDSKRVAEIMTPRTVVFCLPAEMTVDEAMEAHKNWPHTRVPVYEGEDSEDIVGVVYRRQVYEAAAEDRGGTALGALMRPVRFVGENLTLDKALRSFLESRQHLFVVLDEYGGVAGVVTLEDVLEELLGSEIVDETDEVVDMRELARRRRSAAAPTGKVGSGGQQGA